MKTLVRCASLILLVTASLLSADLDAEMKKLDSLASDPDGKLLITATIAEQLGVHRNRITLLRKETGQSYSSILVQGLGNSGRNDSEVLAKVRHVNAEIEQSLSGGARSVHPVAYVTTTLDYSSVGSIYTVLPEFGIALRRASLFVSLPVYRVTGTQPTATGIGDAQISAILNHSGERTAAWASVSVGVPTGDRDRGLGAGKATIDLSGTFSLRINRARLFGTTGITNSVFRNVGYQRPYITTGNAVYGSAGLEATVTRRFGVGAGGFFLEPRGSQTVLNRMAGGQMPSPQPGMSGGMHVGRDMVGMQVRNGTPVPAESLSDRGPNAWASFALSEAVNLNVTAARSFPFELTTVRVGIGFDIVRLLRK